MASSFFKEYDDYINELKYRLMKIQLRYNECMNNASVAVREERLSFEEAAVIQNQRMDTYYPHIDSIYRLSKDEVDFVREYADVDRNGQLLATFLKSEYLDKRDKLSSMLNSVRTFGYLDSKSSEEARLIVKSDITEYFTTKIDEINSKLDGLESRYGKKAKSSVNYLKLCKEKEELEASLGKFASLEMVSDEVFERIVCQFYKVDKTYYDWYLKMQVKQEYEDGLVYEEHCDLMNGINDRSNSILSSSAQVTMLYKELELANGYLFGILNSFADFDINAAVNSVVEKPKKRLFKKEVLNNKDVLFNAFIQLMGINGLKNYIVKTYGNGEISVNLNKVFETYFNNKYGEDAFYVEPITFLNDLRKDVVFYYKIIIEDIMSKINEFNVKISSSTNILCGNIRTCVSQANLQREIRKQYPARSDELMIKGFSFEELERLYTDLKEYIRNGFSFGSSDDDKLILRKV